MKRTYETPVENTPAPKRVCLDRQFNEAVVRGDLNKVQQFLKQNTEPFLNRDALVLSSIKGSDINIFKLLLTAYKGSIHDVSEKIIFGANLEAIQYLFSQPNFDAVGCAIKQLPVILDAVADHVDLLKYYVKTIRAEQGEAESPFLLDVYVKAANRGKIKSMNFLIEQPEVEYKAAIKRYVGYISNSIYRFEERSQVLTTLFQHSQFNCDLVSLIIDSAFDKKEAINIFVKAFHTRMWNRFGGFFTASTKDNNRDVFRLIMQSLVDQDAIETFSKMSSSSLTS
jgi:hypothetical protein